MDEVNGVCLQYLQGMITAEEGMNKILALQAEAALNVIIDAEARDVSENKQVIQRLLEWLSQYFQHFARDLGSLGN